MVTGRVAAAWMEGRRWKRAHCSARASLHPERKLGLRGECGVSFIMRPGSGLCGW